ncbi:MAG TPA: hypothetical protein VG889_19635 [Rhizomicrobium sp.]|nr:hypothetical protein [Rhizomicrobium sp.]
MRLGRLWACLVVAAVWAGDAAAQQYYVPDYYHRGGGRCRAYADPSERAECRQQRRMERGQRYGQLYQDEQPPQQVRQPYENSSTYEAPAQSRLASAIDDLVAADSASWVVHHFRRGSVHGEQIESTDQRGRPTSVRAHFNYQTGSSGWVRIKFADGNFSCMEFWDFAGTCRALGASPSRALAAAAVVVGTVAVAAAVTGGGGHGGGSSSVEAEMKREKDQRDFRDMIQANRQINQNLGNP